MDSRCLARLRATNPILILPLPPSRRSTTHHRCARQAAAPAAMGFLPILSALFGWVYFLCWSASFYPQALLNWRRQSTSGTTVDFPLLNVLGFAAYFTSSLAFYISPSVRAQYAARHAGLTPTVQLNDITFALHGLTLSVITASQYLFSRTLWGFEPSLGARPSRLALGISAGCLLGVACVGFIVIGTSDADFDPATGWCALDVVYATGYVKVVVTLVKYTPQLLANWRNRSTRGWSIWQILLDLAGGVLSIGQQAIDSWLQRDWSGITGNPVKFALGNASMVYDGAFILQHYVLYRGSRYKDVEENGEERRRLLGDERRGG